MNGGQWRLVNGGKTGLVTLSPRMLGRSYWPEIWTENLNKDFQQVCLFFPHNSNLWQNGGHFSLKSRFLWVLHYKYDFQTFYSFFELSAWNLVGIQQTVGRTSDRKITWRNYFTFRDIQRQSWKVHPDGLKGISVSFFFISFRKVLLIWNLVRMCK